MMADTAAPAASATGGARKGSGGFFQKKEAGLPIWAWVLIVGGAGVAILVYLRMQSSSTATATGTTTGTLPTTTTSPGGFGYGGYGGSGTGGSGSAPPPVVQPGGPAQGVAPVSPTAPASPTPASPGNPSLPFQVQSGSGWWAGGSNWATDTPAQQQQAISAAQAAGPITDASGNEYEWVDPQEYQSIQGSGVQVYYEVLPGVFVPVPTNMGSLAPGTPLYMQVPSGTAANPSSPVAAPAYPLSGSTPTAQPLNGAPVYNGAAS